VRAIRENYQQELESLLAVDEGVQGIVDTLRDTGTLDNTLIFFTSDNGFFHGEHRIPNGKILPYEPSIRVPLIVRGPGIPQNVHRSQLVANIDLAPTFAAWAGVEVPAKVDGRSLTPLLAATPPADWRKATLIEHMNSATGKDDPDSENASINDTTTPTVSATTAPVAKSTKAGKKKANAAGKTKRKKAKKAGKGGGGVPLYSAMRTDSYVYVEYRDGAHELYDLKTDPQELNNLAGNASPALMTQLSARLAELSKCAGATCRTAESAPVPDISRALKASAT